MPPDVNINVQRALCADSNELARIEALAIQYWGTRKNGKPNWPSHWTSLNAHARAQHAGQDWEARYVRDYSWLSWHIHAGVVGFAGLPADAAHAFVAIAHRLTTASTIDAYEIIGRELHVAPAVSRWGDKIAFLRIIGGLALTELQLRSLGEPPRLDYLEDHERQIV